MHYFGRKAEMGVGTLIIFIALLLVAAVAAGVLIQTAGSLQQRALSTGAQATTQVATNAQVIEISGSDGTATLNNLTISIRLAPGSDPIQFSSSVLSINLNNASQTYIYLAGSTYGNTTGYGIQYVQQGATHQAGVLVHGDVVYINLASPRALAAGDNVRINFVPKAGTPTMTAFNVPDVIGTQRVYLYP